MTKGIYAKEISKTACEREIFYPRELDVYKRQIPINRNPKKWN